MMKRDGDEAAALIRIVAGPRQPGETTKARIRRTAQALGWSYSRTRHVWHGDAKRIEAHEMDQLRQKNAALSPTIPSSIKDSD